MNKTRSLHIGQDILIAVLALVTLFFAALSVMAMLPSGTDVEIYETITVSSSRLNGYDEAEGIYIVEAGGMLRNTTSESITVEKLTVPANGSDRKKAGVVLIAENLVIPPRSSVAVVASGTSNEDCNRTGEIMAQINGEQIFLRNPAEISPVVTLIPLALMLLSGFFTVRAGKIRYYMYQEDQAAKKAA